MDVLNLTDAWRISGRFPSYTASWEICLHFLLYANCQGSNPVILKCLRLWHCPLILHLESRQHLERSNPAWGHNKDICSERSCPPPPKWKWKCSLHIVTVERMGKTHTTVKPSIRTFFFQLSPWQDRGVSCQRSKQSHLLTSDLSPSGFNTSVPFGQNSSSSSAHLLADSSTTSEHHFRTLFSTKAFAPGAVPWALPEVSVSSACSQPGWLLKASVPCLGALLSVPRQDAAGNVWPPLHDHLLKPGLLWHESNTK